MSGKLLRIVGTGLLLAAGLATAALAQKADTPLLTGTPKPAPKADGTQVEFLVGSQSLILRLPPGEVPKVLELRRPSRLEVEFAGTSAAPGGAAFATGVVSRYDVVHLANNRTRAILFLRSPLKQRPTIQYLADRVVIAVVPKMAPRPDQVLPSASPFSYNSPKPHLTPVPTAPPSSGPTPRITPVPVPSATLPVPREIPPISGVGAGA